MAYSRPKRDTKILKMTMNTSLTGINCQIISVHFILSKALKLYH